MIAQSDNAAGASMQFLRDAVITITGGTGSFGNAVLRRLLGSDIREIRILSRDEKKQDDMRKHYSHPKLKFYLGDVRDRSSLEHAFVGADFCFHAAALKQVPSCEFHPMEAVKTNVIGTDNVLSVAIAAGLRKVVCLSTDKAVYPINAMGISKAMMEKVLVARARTAGDRTVVSAVRYGNVMASRGSVIPLFVHQVKRGEAITITDPTMTRFMMTLDEAVDLVLYAFVHGSNGDIFVQKAPAATIATLARAICEVMEKPEHEIKLIGTRHGEKVYETLLSREERAAAEDLGAHFRVPPDLRDLNYSKFVEQGEVRITVAEDYHSHNTTQLGIEEMKALLRKLEFVNAFVRGGSAEPEE